MILISSLKWSSLFITTFSSFASRRGATKTEFYFGCTPQLCALANWEHNSQMYQLVQIKSMTVDYLQNGDLFRKPQIHFLEELDILLILHMIECECRTFPPNAFLVCGETRHLHLTQRHMNNQSIQKLFRGAGVGLSRVESDPKHRFAFQTHCWEKLLIFLLHIDISTIDINITVPAV